MIASLENLTSKSISHILSETNEQVHIIDRTCIDKYDLSQITVLLCRDRDITETLLTKFASLKMIFILSVGVDKLPLELLSKRNILVSHVDGNICAQAIAEYVITSILMINCNMIESYSNQLQHFWKKSQVIDTLSQKKILIAGYGAIGKKIASCCKFFNMEIYITSKIEKQNDGIFDYWLNIETVKNRLNEFNFIVNAMPLTNETFHFWGNQEFSAMNNSSVFVNIARGAVVNEKDLVNALRKKEIKYAILDVFEQEPLPYHNELWSLENVLITPHTSGRIKDFVDNAIPYFIKNYNAFISEIKLPNQVDLLRGY